jgi:hypothetical protein
MAPTGRNIAYFRIKIQQYPAGNAPAVTPNVLVAIVFFVVTLMP